MPIYRTSGVLTGTIAPENVAAAQAHLTEDDMTQYLHGYSDVPNPEVIEHIEWKLEGDGHNWSVTAFAIAQLTEAQLKELSEWVSGQNSDGLGEGFEQQDFAWDEDSPEEEECGECQGTGVDGNDSDDDCSNCDGVGYFEQGDDGRMISFDWTTNKCKFVRVK